jgi:hypothetical protein
MTRHERLVYGFMLSLVPNWADADEILQETNIRLWDEFEKFVPRTNFAAWAVRIARFSAHMAEARHPQPTGVRSAGKQRAGVGIGAGRSVDFPFSIWKREVPQVGPVTFGGIEPHAVRFQGFNMYGIAAAASKADAR